MRHQLAAKSNQQTEAAIGKDQIASQRRNDCHRSRFTVSGFLFLALFLACASGAVGQTCSDPPPQTFGSHSFRQQGESFDLPINIADCQPLTLELRWSNGRNNGSNFHVTFYDSDNQAIYTKEISGFLSGSFQFPFATLEPQASLGSLSVVSVPVKVTIEAVRPFAAPATINYRVTRIAPHSSESRQVEYREPETGSRGKTERAKAELLELTDGKIRKP